MITAHKVALEIVNRCIIREGGLNDSCSLHVSIKDALTAFRNEAIEEAACVAEKCNPNPNGEYDHDHQLCGQIALEIRALKKE